VREIPKLLRGDMVRAVLEGRKTQTRLPCKQMATGSPQYDVHDGKLWFDDNPWSEVESPFGSPGDILWVRETWVHYQTVNHIRRSNGASLCEMSCGLAGYRADGHDTIEDFRNHVKAMSGCDLEQVFIRSDKWQPSIHMPRWACRLRLRVKRVWVHRAHDISEKEARSEGVTPEKAINRVEYAFAYLWDSIYGKQYPWSSNPWVWACEFERIA
jgi:hypothetical protein